MVGRVQRQDVRGGTHEEEANDAEQQVVVERLTVKPGKTELALSFWFRIRPQAAAANAGTASTAAPGATLAVAR